MQCESCGMPMEKPEDYGANNVANKYCKYCAPDGNLKSREEAEKKIDEQMKKMPAWQE